MIRFGYCFGHHASLVTSTVIPCCQVTNKAQAGGGEVLLVAGVRLVR